MPNRTQTDETFSARMVSVRALTPNHAPETVYEIHLRVPAAMGIEPGLHLGVRVPESAGHDRDAHERLYTVVGTTARDEEVEAVLYVRRCGPTPAAPDHRMGITSNWLCDRAPGDSVTVAGPYGTPFAPPADPAADLILIAQGTGIAAFQALLRDLENQPRAYSGTVRLYFAGPDGLARVFYATLDRHLSARLRTRLHLPTGADTQAAADDLHAALTDDADTLRPLLAAPHTHVCVAGLKVLAAPLGAALAHVMGGDHAWQDLHKQLRREGRWQELLY